MNKQKVSYTNKRFYINGNPMQIYSGAIHYFRTMPQDWHDRLNKLKKCGFNTVETYVAWNGHEPEENQFCFDGLYDIEGFIKTATELGLYIIVRPGPYICAEWDFGGLPAWLLKYRDMHYRCSDPMFLQKVDSFFDVLIPKLIPYLSTNGGNIIAMQIENEYGSFGSDKIYLNHIKSKLIEHGVDVMLFTSDGPCDAMITAGSCDDTLVTVNFGSEPEERFNCISKRYPDMPLMCMEYWNGWFDHWGGKHTTRDADSVIKDTAYMVENNISFNMYMFHGGTNFGYNSGANLVADNTFMPTVTSYDYDAILTEDGTPTKKYWGIKSILNPNETVEFPSYRASYGLLKFEKQAALFDNIDNISHYRKSVAPLTIEDFGKNYGFILYKTLIDGPREEMPLIMNDMHDRAIVYDNNCEKAIYYRNELVTHYQICCESAKEITVLVENMGHVNYGPKMLERKGLTNGLRLGDDYGHYLSHFDNYAIDTDLLDKINFNNDVHAIKQPSFLKTTLSVETPMDTFVKLNNMTKGVVFVNGFNLGRYWNIGPLMSLYLPRHLLNKGDNEIIVLELHETTNPTIEFIDHPILINT